VLLDKPPGPSSFALVAGLRRRTHARTGHAGTLDPFASGLLVCLSGAATRLAPCFVGLDKRYLTTVDLTATTSTGDPEGEMLERHAPPAAAELDARLAALRGEVELAVPAASAVKVGGERAYRLARRGVAVELPVRRTTVYELEPTALAGGLLALRLHVASGTYVRSLAAALGGHCTSLRRTAVGPFTVGEADPDRLLPAAEALERLPAGARARVPERVRAHVVAVEAASGPAALPPAPRGPA
jgi:tRNA pseudouridine55 synthase